MADPGDGAFAAEFRREFRCGDGRARGATALNVEENQPPAARPTALLLSRHRNWALCLGPYLHLRSPFQVIHRSAPEVDRARQYRRSGMGWSPQSFVLRPACHAGAHVRVGIARPHIQSRAIERSLRALSPARYRALRIRFDPPQPTAMLAELVLSLRPHAAFVPLSSCIILAPPLPRLCWQAARLLPRTGTASHRPTCGA